MRAAQPQPLVVTKRMRRSRLVLALALALGLVPRLADAAAAASCRYVLGFQTLAHALPYRVGDCLEDQAFAASWSPLGWACMNV
jgi:ABC-type sugar transport system substrate-binding protein